MRPTPVEIMRGIQGAIVAHSIPELASSYAQAQAMYSVMLMEVMVTNQERAASDLRDSNRQFAALLQRTKAALEQAGPGAPSEAKQALESLAAARLEPDESSIVLTDLRAEWSRLAELVAKVAPLVERSPAEVALLTLRPLRQQYLDILRADTQRRLVPVLGSG